jgi:hypothetical protein
MIMKDDPICRAKWRVQRKFARMAGHDPGRYLQLVHENVERWAEKNGIRLKYADVSQMQIGPLRVKESATEYTTARPLPREQKRRRVRGTPRKKT